MTSNELKMIRTAFIIAVLSVASGLFSFANGEGQFAELNAPALGSSLDVDGRHEKLDENKVESDDDTDGDDDDENLEFEPTKNYESVNRTWIGKPSKAQVWGYGFLSITVISLLSTLGVLIFPALSNHREQLLRTCIGLAVGSLSATSIFHLFPQAFNLMQYDPDHGYLKVALTAWLSVWLFYLIDSGLKVYQFAKENLHKRRAVQPRNNRGGKELDHQNGILLPRQAELSIIAENGKKSAPVENGTGHILLGFPEKSKIDEMESDCESPMPYSKCEVAVYDSRSSPKPAFWGSTSSLTSRHRHSHFQQLTHSGDITRTNGAVATVAWMVVFGDSLHNFADGMTIGAALTESIWSGICISIAIVCEEFPHELGDFAVLLNSGMSVKQALFYNFLSACTAFAGLVVGIFLGQLDASVYIFAFAAGLFLYISLADMVPELNEMLENAKEKGPMEAVRVLLWQNLGILTGVTILYVLAVYQNDLQKL